MGVTILVAVLSIVVIVLGKSWSSLRGGVGDDVATAAEREQQKLSGHWTAPGNGAAEQVKVFLVGRRFTVKWSDGSFDQGTYRVDPGRQPHTIDLVVAEGVHQGKTLLGVYERARGTLHLCCAGPGRERPDRCAADAERGWRLYLFERVGD